MLHLQVATGADPQAALAEAAQGSNGSLLVFGSNSGFFEAQKAAGQRCACGPLSSQASRATRGVGACAAAVAQAQLSFPIMSVQEKTLRTSLNDVVAGVQRPPPP